MRISDWSSDVCSSDLTLAQVSDAESTAEVVCSETARLLDVNTVVLGRRDGQTVIVGAYPPRSTLGPIDIAAADWAFSHGEPTGRSEEHTSELQSLMRISYAVFCLKKKKKRQKKKYSKHRSKTDTHK